MATIAKSREECLFRFGFTFDGGGTHLARSMMLQELDLLLRSVSGHEATTEEYLHAVVEENCLAKRSSRTRSITFRHLKCLYGLDPSLAIFRALRFFWDRDRDARNLLAFLVAYSRDSLLRSSAGFVLSLRDGQSVTCPELQEFLEIRDEGRFSQETLRAAAQRILASWTQSGYFVGRVVKTRTTPVPTAGNCAMALFFSYLTGARGQMLFETEYLRLLGCSTDQAIDLAESASRRGWIVFKHVGNVFEVQFPGLLTKQEREWVHEQS